MPQKEGEEKRKLLILDWISHVIDSNNIFFDFLWHNKLEDTNIETKPFLKGFGSIKAKGFGFNTSKNSSSRATLLPYMKNQCTHLEVSTII